jgi:protein FRG1
MTFLGWAFVEELRDFGGPLFLLQRDENDQLRYISISEQGRVQLLLVSEGVNVEEAEPQDISQVIVGQWLMDQTVFSLKTAYRKYMSSDSFGLVRLDKEAVGPQEEWTPILRSEGVTFQNSYQKFLKYDSSLKGFRADSEFIGFHEIFTVKCQAKFKVKEKQPVKEIDPLFFEIDQV